MSRAKKKIVPIIKIVPESADWLRTVKSKHKIPLMKLQCSDVRHGTVEGCQYNKKIQRKNCLESARQNKHGKGW